ncbi:hypothetical protein Q4601_17655 [Shewanella sp. 1_MG-2023]|uniref:Extradiol ring-cleavage dioxygenase LigAB LigA subunit domain-containing protein n=1 Tax=Shewanella electrodiphila TaxID=934143 RepID=A0ABT0KLR6_9GAMM|nr:MULTISPECIES: hypothetical protein [Shewanella]MCC4833185.1 hypothetical protein [Shewanella sp. 10N.7]MCL1044719.1 hypothetical protein [Shewanella electrodiphila]MDO6613149.1 hypothetical protein [Shewanella sp. 7_MG-2023]MDO6773018.1 hypothetical protein [Shewanella sp. 2_MG-2023]MDO6796126.1 hypothetical protein [Shewanella sp. 1_MG-2023]
MSKLSSFLTDLSSDAKLKQAYESSPEKVMQDYGLSKEEQEAVMSCDEGKVCALIGDVDKSKILFVHHS